MKRTVREAKFQSRCRENILVDDNVDPCMIPEEDEAIYAYYFITLLKIIDGQWHIMHPIQQGEYSRQRKIFRLALGL